MRIRDAVSRSVRALSTLIVVLFLSCHSYVMNPAAPRTAPDFPSERTFRVTLVDGQRLMLNHVTVVNDTLSGSTHWGVEHDVRIPMVQVVQIEERHFNGFKTAGLVLGVAAGLFAAAVVAFIIECNRTDCFN